MIHGELFRKGYSMGRSTLFSEAIRIQSIVSIHATVMAAINLPWLGEAMAYKQQNDSKMYLWRFPLQSTAPQIL